MSHRYNMNEFESHSPMTEAHSNMESSHGDDTTMGSKRADHGMHKGMGNALLELGLDDPPKWPLPKKIYASLVSCGFTFALLFGATAYTTGIQGVMAEFDVSMTKAILPYSLFIWGIFFAPIYSPHVSERFGRTVPYFVSTTGLAVFTLGAAYSETYTQLAVCRFFAGLCGGSNAVQIEGTFADVWPALYTGTYYSALTCASYFGAATGAIVGWHVIPATSWRWTQYLSLMFTLASLLLGVGMPETYRRQVIRIKAKRLGQPHNLPMAPSGITLSQMAKLTLLDPVIMLASQPLVIMITLYLALNFGVLFSWFIAVPAVLTGVAKYTPRQVGSAFATAIGGMAMGALTSAAIDQISTRFVTRNASRCKSIDVEHRLFPAMVGTALLITSLFWIGWTAVPTVSPVVPIVGNGVYVWGSSMTLISFISYLFDAYPPQGTLSALTAAACTRLAFAGIIPLVIIIAITNLTGAWAFSTFGFIAAAFSVFPFVLYFWGKKMRTGSRFYDEDHLTPLEEQAQMMKTVKTEKTEMVGGKMDRRGEMMA